MIHENLVSSKYAKVEYSSNLSNESMGFTEYLFWQVALL